MGKITAQEGLGAWEEKWGRELLGIAVVFIFHLQCEIAHQCALAPENAKAFVRGEDGYPGECV